MAQGGCPNGIGNGGPGYTIDCETKGGNQYHDKGVLSMAHADPNTGGSQFLLCILVKQLLILMVVILASEKLQKVWKLLIKFVKVIHLV